MVLRRHCRRRRGRFAFWNIDDVARASFEALVMNAVPMKIEDGTHAHETGRSDYRAELRQK
jgi:hypothetical protein